MLTLNSINMKRIIYFHLFFLLVIGFLISDLGLPNNAMYALDLLVIIEFIYAVRLYRSSFSQLNIIPIIAIVILLLLFSLINFVLGSYSILLYFNGFRNSFKYFVFLASCIVILDKNDIENIFEMLYRFLLVNVPICTFQYFVQGNTGDFCNGLFGSNKTNSWLNALLIIVTTYGVVKYISKQMKLLKFGIIGLSALYISVLAELKFYFFELILIILLALLLNRPNRKTIMLVITGVFFVLSIRNITAQLWPDSAKYFTLEGIEYYLTQDDYGYASASDIGRIDGINKVNSIFFSEKNEINLFGYGLGACDSSSIEQLNSPFFKEYEYLHYIWFTYLMTYLELGWVGLILYFLFFIAMFIYSFRSVRISLRSNRPSDIHIVVAIMAVLSMVLMFYNTTIRNIPAFFVFCILSFSAVLNKPVPDISTEKIKLFKQVRFTLN